MLGILGVPAIFTFIPSDLFPSQRSGRSASLRKGSREGADPSASGLSSPQEGAALGRGSAGSPCVPSRRSMLPDPYSWATLGSSPGGSRGTAGPPQGRVPPRASFKAGLSETFPEGPHLSQVLRRLAEKLEPKSRELSLSLPSFLPLFPPDHL